MIVVVGVSVPVHAERGVHATHLAEGLGERLGGAPEPLPQVAILDGDVERGELVAVTVHF